jgi:hypothetical protein
MVQRHTVKEAAWLRTDCGCAGLFDAKNLLVAVGKASECADGAEEYDTKVLGKLVLLFPYLGYPQEAKSKQITRGFEFKFCRVFSASCCKIREVPVLQRGYDRAEICKSCFAPESSRSGLVEYIVNGAKSPRG